MTEVSKKYRPNCERDDARNEMPESELLAQLGELTSLEGLRRAIKPEQSPSEIMKKKLNNAIIGQEPAIESIVSALQRESLREINKPHTSLLFLGPTGVGKTETARELDRQLHGDEGNLIRIDCSDYQHSHQTTALIGAPPGYVGHDQIPKLAPQNVEGDKRIILFDELEKASPALFKMLLQVLEEGQLTMLNSDQSTDFRNSIIIMTSNLGAKEMQDVLGGKSTGFRHPGQASEEQPAQKHLDKAVTDEVARVLPPELIGRIEQRVIFNPLDDEQLAEVVKRHIEKRNQQIEGEGIHLHLSDALINSLVTSESERKQYGGRKIVKNFERIVMPTLSEYVASGSIPRGSKVYAALAKSADGMATDSEFELFYSEDAALLKRYQDIYGSDDEPTSPSSPAENEETADYTDDSTIVKPRRALMPDKPEDS